MGESIRKLLLVTAIGWVFISGCAKESDSKPTQSPVQPKNNAAAGPGVIISAGSAGVLANNTDKPVVTEVSAPKKTGPFKPKNNFEAFVPQGSPASPKTWGPGDILEGPFSGSANDYLPQVLRSRLEREPVAEKKAANFDRAKSVQNVEFSKEGEKAHLSIHLRVSTAPSGATRLSLHGKVNENSEGQLSGANKHVSGIAKLKCWDQTLDGNCESVVATIQITEAKKASLLVVLIRKSAAIFDVKLPKEDVTDSAYVTLVRMFKFTAYNLKVQESFKQQSLESYEVVNGIAREKLVLVGRNGEILQISFPLIKQTDSERLSVKADPVLTIEEALKISGGEAFSTHIAEKITSATLIENNGFGEVGLSLKMAALENLPQDEIILRLTRKIKKVSY